jgi:DNA-binding MarR family transcriptional regulator
MDDFAQCMVTNSRMAARAITRRYDAYLRPFGLSATQLSLLSAIDTMPDATVSDLAEARGFERTTLTRNLDRLEAMDVIAPRAPGKGNARISEITPKGRALMSELLPYWRKAQADIKAELTREGFDEALGVLKRLAKVQETNHERS